MNCSIAEQTDRYTPEKLERWIEQRTGGRVHYLQVKPNGERLTIRGFTGSYYVRQLALAAVLEVIAPDELEHVDVEIQVGAPTAPKPMSFANIPHRAPATHPVDHPFAVAT